jgi:hypothetical protein
LGLDDQLPAVLEEVDGEVAADREVAAEAAEATAEDAAGDAEAADAGIRVPQDAPPPQDGDEVDEPEL